MAIEIWEAFDSRDAALAKKQSDTTHRARYFATGSDNDAEIKAAALFSIPANWVSSQGGDALERQSIDVKRIGVTTWELDVHYGAAEDEDSQEEPETGDGDYTFDTSGGTQNVQVARTVGTKPKQDVYDRNGLVKDAQNNPEDPFGGALNVTGESGKEKPHGVDITIPTLKFTRTHYLPSSLVTPSYVKTLAGLTGCVNSSAWNSFAAGELLFLGAQGQRRGSKDWQVTFSFDASSNQTNVAIGTGSFKITVPSVKGWEYLWVKWGTVKHETLPIMVPFPVQACVAQIYPESDFSQLGIGG
jgi:hypothetical protein